MTVLISSSPHGSIQVNRLTREQKMQCIQLVSCPDLDLCCPGDISEALDALRQGMQALGGTLVSEEGTYLYVTFGKTRTGPD